MFSSALSTDDDVRWVMGKGLKPLNRACHLGVGTSGEAGLRQGNVDYVYSSTCHTGPGGVLPTSRQNLGLVGPDRRRSHRSISPRGVLSRLSRRSDSRGVKSLVSVLHRGVVVRIFGRRQTESHGRCTRSIHAVIDPATPYVPQFLCFRNVRHGRQ